MYNRVLVPVDGSDVATAVLPFILGIAGPLDFEVVLLRVNQPVSPVVLEASRYMEIEDEEGRRAETESYLKGLAATIE